MEAMVVEFDTFDSHPPFLLNGDVGTGCSRGVFQQVSPCTSLLSLCVQGRCNLRDHGTSLFFHDSGEWPLFLPPYCLEVGCSESCAPSSRTMMGGSNGRM